MSDAFKVCHKVTHRWEHGYSNHPRDPGGATQDGVTQRVYDAWRRAHSLPVQPVRLSTEDERLTIFRAQFWDAVQGERLPPGVDLAVYDFAVNSGPSRAIRYLQAALGVATDGHIGAVTLRAAADAWERGDASKIVSSIMDGREAFLRGLSTFPTFGKGWINRTRDVRREALRRASASYVMPGSKLGSKAQARPAGANDAYQPDKAAPAPAQPAKAAKQASLLAMFLGLVLSVVEAAKDTLGDWLSPPVLFGVLISGLIAASALAWFKSGKVEQ